MRQRKKRYGESKLVSCNLAANEAATVSRVREMLAMDACPFRDAILHAYDVVLNIEREAGASGASSSKK